MLLMVIIGGITRLTHSGLSITEWNIVIGTIPPLNEQHWQELFEKYQQSPEFREKHFYFALSDFKSIYWWEYFHRLLGRIIGIVFTFPFIYFLLKKKISQSLLPKLIIIFLFGALQGFLGWFMVKSGLKDKPDVSHYRLAIHLITAFLTFGYTFWISLTLIPLPACQTERKKIYPIYYLSIILFVVILLQIIYGAFVAGLKAGFIYPTFPKMNGQWIAEEIIFALSNYGWISIFENGATIQFIHRWLAVIVLILSAALWLLSRKREIPLLVRQSVSVVIIIVILQFLLGILTLIYTVPISLAVAHQAGAFFLFTAVLLLHYRLKVILG